MHLPGKVDTSRVLKCFPLKTEWWSKKKKFRVRIPPWPFELSDLEHRFPHLQNGHYSYFPESVSQDGKAEKRRGKQVVQMAKNYMQF